VKPRPLGLRALLIEPQHSSPGRCQFMEVAEPAFSRLGFLAEGPYAPDNGPGYAEGLTRLGTSATPTGLDRSSLLDAAIGASLRVQFFRPVNYTDAKCVAPVVAPDSRLNAGRLLRRTAALASSYSVDSSQRCATTRAASPSLRLTGGARLQSGRTG